MYCMVLPLVDEDKPKCYLCHARFDNIDELREHQQTTCRKISDMPEKAMPHEPAPGDVAVF